MRIAFSLVPMPSSATLVPSGPWASEQLQQPRSRFARRFSQVPLPHAQPHRFGDLADPGDRAGDDQGSLPGALHRGNEALAAGQVAEGPRRGQLPRVGNRASPRDPQPQVTASGAGDACLRAAVEGRGHRGAATAKTPDVGAHHPRQHLLGYTRQGGDPRTRLARRLAGRGVRERLHGGRQHDIGAGHSSRQPRGRLPGMRCPLGHHREDRLRSGLRRLVAQCVPDRFGRRVADHQHLLAVADPQALPNDRPNSPIEVPVHPASLEKPGGDRPAPRS